MTSWWRSWHGAPTDAKWLLIASKANVAPGIVSAVAWALFDYASQHEKRGSVADFDIETYAAFSGFEQKQIEAVLAAMTAKKLIVKHMLSSWEKRQPKREDNSAERVTRHRERKSTQGNAVKRTVTHCNAPDREIDISDRTERKNLGENGIWEERQRGSTAEQISGSAKANGRGVFVIEGSEPWLAWRDFREKEEGFKTIPTTTGVVNGRQKTGWYFPSLYPPDKPARQQHEAAE